MEVLKGQAAVVYHRLPFHGRDVPRQLSFTFRTLCVPKSAQATMPVPSGPDQMVLQAAKAIEEAYRGGIKRQRVELLLPLIGATDLDDWPGGIRQQFKAVKPLVETILRKVKQIEGLQGGLVGEIWDAGDAVASWRGDQLAAVVFPTAQALDQLRVLAFSDPSLLLIFNPQWESKGNLMSEFGFGERRRSNEEFVDSFIPTYYLKSLRVYGDDIRVLRGYPSSWQLHIMDKRTGTCDCIAVKDTMPQYQDIEDTLRQQPDSSMNKTWVQRIQEEYYFNQESLRPPP